MYLTELFLWETKNVICIFIATETLSCVVLVFYSQK